MTSERLLGVAAGIVADRLVGFEPPNEWHPVAWLGRALGRVERSLYRDDRAAGVAHAVVGVAIGAIGGLALGSTVAVTWTCCAGRMLADVALEVRRALDRGDGDEARRLLPALVGRDPAALDEAGVARAVVESVAENTVDAVVAPAFWAAALGPVGAGVHKAASTLDSRVGHRSARYQRFGWASARLDDALAWLPARVMALLVVAVRPRAASDVWRTVRRDSPAHPSPNAGVAESAFAAALGVQLGGINRYGDRVEHRPLLGDGRVPEPVDIVAAVQLSRDVSLALAGAFAAVGLAPFGRRRR